MTKSHGTFEDFVKKYLAEPIELRPWQTAWLRAMDEHPPLDGHEWRLLRGRMGCIMFCETCGVPVGQKVEAKVTKSAYLTAEAELHLRMMTRPGVAALARQGRSYHAAGFAQDVIGKGGRLIHAELNEDGIWRLEDAKTAEPLGLFVP